MSTSELMLDVSQAHELKMAFRRNGWTNANIKTLSEGSLLTNVLQVIKGQSEIKPIKHLIDTNALPFVPPGMSVEKHVGHGMWQWNPNIELFLSKEQEKNYQEGNKLWRVIESLDKKALNANVLDFLLDHPELIPENWQDKLVFFWGTIYCDSDDSLCVRYLDWLGSRWDWDYYWLDSAFHASDPAVLAS